MELTPEKPKRGRPRKPVHEAQLLTELVGVVRDTLTQQQHILQQLALAQQSQTELLSTWMRLMTPPATPTPSTTADQREALRAAAEADWEPVLAPRLSDLFDETFAS
jgi:hypothetical protein